MNVVKIFLATVLVTFQLNALIIESNEISSVFSHVGQESTLIIFDIDNTLVHVADGNGGDEWFYATLAANVKKGLSLELATQKTVTEYEKKQLVIDLQAVEELTASVVRSAQINYPNVKVIALSNRGGLLMQRTIDQLAKIGIDFTVNSPYSAELIFDGGSKYMQGILFAKGNSKHALMEQYFKLTGYTPAKIIYINDKEKYLRPFTDIFEALGIQFIGIRYSYLDEKVKNFKLE